MSTIFRDQDPFVGRVYYFRRGLRCSACDAPIGQHDALFRQTEESVDQASAPSWDVIHKGGVGGIDGCDDGSGRWTNLVLTPPLLITLHDRALRCLVQNGIMTNEQRLKQIALFSELLYEASDRGFSSPSALTQEEIDDRVRRDDLVPVGPGDPI